jgi:hypothetical protein
MPIEAGRHIGQSNLDLRSRPLLSQQDLTASAQADNMERVLADIDADYGGFSFLKHGLLPYPDTLLEYPRLAGARPHHPIS